jgi:hypothetical protein
MRLVFKHNNSMETNISNKQVEPQEIEKIRKRRRSGMRIMLWLYQKNKHLPPNRVRDFIERETLRKTIGNFALRRTPNISERRSRNN